MILKMIRKTLIWCRKTKLQTIQERYKCNNVTKRDALIELFIEHVIV